jgi:hypothetical protein
MRHQPFRLISWNHFVAIFFATFFGALAAVYLFVLLIDPYGVVPFSLPIKRPIVSLNQRHEYPKIVRSGEFDSIIVGTSTSRLLDPEILDPLFQARFANLAMNSMSAWEQSRMIEYFHHHIQAPKFVVIGLDGVWCDEHPMPVPPIAGPFPYWLYGDSSWDAYPHLLNEPTVELSARTFGYNLRLYPERVRGDGFEVFTPPENTYDLTRAQHNIWDGRRSLPLGGLSTEELENLSLPALQWLDDALRPFRDSTTKILAFMPVHVAAQPRPGTRVAAVETECKARIAAIARERHAQMIDWRIASPITSADENYWDALHYRLSIAERLAHELATAHKGIASSHGDYEIVVR